MGLKKEFKRKDVERMRSIVRGEQHESAERQIGYHKVKRDVKRKEGEEWEEDGKKWIMKDGIKQNITNFQEHRMPHFCPNCGNIMKKRLDTKFYNIYNKCMDCVIDEQHQMKLEGTYKAYEEKVIRQNAQEYFKDFENYIIDTIKNIDNYYSERGDKQQWVGKKIDEDEIKENLKELKKRVE